MTAYVPDIESKLAAVTAFYRAGWEWRVTWRRRRWGGSQSKTFERKHDALARIAKLTSGGRPDLEPFVRLDLHMRPVGRWELVESYTEVEQ